MPVGIQPSLSQLNQQAGQIVLNVRNDMHNVLNFNAYLEAIGGAQGLQDEFSMAPDDAATMISTFGNLSVVAQAYMGNGLISVSFNYEANSVPFTGGQ